MAEGEMKFTFTNREAVLAVFKQYHESYQRYLTCLASQVDRNVDTNKQIAAFYERLLLLDLGTIAISVTALASLIAHLTEGRHLPKGTFISLIIPAWFLLLASAFLCRHIMSLTIQANSGLQHQWAHAVSLYNFGEMSKQLTSLSTVLDGTMRIGEEEHEISKFFKSQAQSINNSAAKIETPKPPETSSSQRYGAVAMGFMQLALILLCISAIRLLLAL
jgi:hypothetical protein